MGTCVPGYFTVQTGTVKIVERFGKFNRVARPGLNWKYACGFEQVVGPIDLSIEEMRIQCKSKTKDDVFIAIEVSVQYQILADKVKDAFYKLSQPKNQIEAYVYDVVRSEVPKVILDEVFTMKEVLQNKIRIQLRENMSQFGYQIIAAPVTNIDPDAGVKRAMNQKNTEERMKAARQTAAEAEKIEKISRAEAEAERIRIEARAKSDAKYLQGQGLSRQRMAIIHGLQDSVRVFKEGMPDIETGAVMDLILLTQYFDTLKDIGMTANTSTMFIPTNPSTVKDFASQMRQGILEGNGAANKGVKKGNSVAVNGVPAVSGVPAISGLAPSAPIPFNAI